jgi:HSP20 family protein
MKSESWLPALWGESKADVDPFRLLRTQMDELFNDFSSSLDRIRTPSGMLSLRVDVSETDADVTVKADLPGVEQKDIDVTAIGNQLTIKAEKKSEAEDKKDEKGRVYHRAERTYGLFQRTMTLPFEIDPAKVSASFTDGVLTLNVPKPPDVQKQTRKIEVRKPA